MIDRKTLNEVRKKVKQACPGLHFKIRKVSFSDLARDERYFLESGHWGMTKGNHILFNKVKEIVDSITSYIIVSW